MKPEILIIGAGEIGQAIGKTIKPRSRVSFFDATPGKVPRQRPLQELVSKAEGIFLCLPSIGIRSVCAQIKPFLGPKTVVISLAKGLEAKGCLTMPEVMAEEFGRGQPIGVLGGAMIAEEIFRGEPAIGVLGAFQSQVWNFIKPLFKDSCLHLSVSSDVRGVAFASVLKNIYSLAIGVADGLGWGVNAKGYLTAMSFHEMDHVTSALRVSSETILGPAGLGDFIATSSSLESRNRLTGELIAKGKPLPPSEGIKAIPCIAKEIGSFADHMPIFLALQKSIKKPHETKKLFNALLSRA